MYNYNYSYDSEVKNLIGATYDDIIDRVNRYEVDKKRMYDFAMSLHPNIGGAHKRRLESGAECDSYEMRQILCDYYGSGMCHLTSEEAVTKLRHSMGVNRVQNVVEKMKIPQVQSLSESSSCNENTGAHRRRTRIRTKSGGRTHTKRKLRTWSEKQEVDPSDTVEQRTEKNRESNKSAGINGGSSTESYVFVPQDNDSERILNQKPSITKTKPNQSLDELRRDFLASTLDPPTTTSGISRNSVSLQLEQRLCLNSKR